MADWRRNAAPDGTKGVFLSQSGIEVITLIPPEAVPARALMPFYDSHGFSDKWKSGDKGTFVRFVTDALCGSIEYEIWWIPAPVLTEDPCYRGHIPPFGARFWTRNQPGLSGSPRDVREFQPPTPPFKGILRDLIVLPPTDAPGNCDPHDDRSKAIGTRVFIDSHGSLDYVRSLQIQGPIVRVLENARCIVFDGNRRKMQRQHQYLRLLPGSIKVEGGYWPHDCCAADCCYDFSDCPSLPPELTLSITECYPTNDPLCCKEGCPDACGDFPLIRAAPMDCEWHNCTETGERHVLTCDGSQMCWHLTCGACGGWTLHMISAPACVAEVYLQPVSVSCDPLHLDFGLVDWNICCGEQSDRGCVRLEVS